MFKLLIVVGVSAALTGIMILLSETINLKLLCESHKASPFECGFDAIAWHRKPFSVHFFFTCIVFLIFDVELLIVLPWLMGKGLGTCHTGSGMASLLLLMVIFVAGLLVEWNSKALDWSS